MIPKKKLRIGDLLVEHKIISENQLQTALSEQRKSGRKLGRMLLELGFIDEDQLLEFLSRQLQVPFVDLRHYRYKADAVRLVPETLARRYRAIVLDNSQDPVLVGMADPTDIFAFDELTKVLKRPIRQAVVRETDLLRTIDSVYRRTEEISSLAEELSEELSETDFDLERLGQAADLSDAPVVKLLQSIFADAVQVGASDIHIEPDESVLRIRQRIDGVLQEQVMKEKRISAALVSRLKLMGGLNISERRLPQDGRFNIRVKDRNIDVRLSTMPIQHGESVVMRLLDQSGGLLDLEAVGMPADVLRHFRRNVRKPHGMVLVTGPTGSGKTTTLYGALNELNQPEKKIITIEDPVEYRLARINQVQVHTKIGLTFAGVLRNALRQDPDVVLVGEIRDQETAEIALRASITGHLVLSTLHTNDAVSTAIRLIDMGIPGYMVATALEAVIAQRLVRRICDSCITDYQPNAQQKAWLENLLGDELKEVTFKAGAGCPHCHNTGYRGRIGVFELLEIDEVLTDCLRRSDSGDFARAAHMKPDFQPLAFQALEYARMGITTLEEVVRVSTDIDTIDLEEDLSGSEIDDADVSAEAGN
ncbi:GspE/PulE family protein [Thiohalomonas denitrificans]|uniref:MSHA biogenesis protein MshE n=1 Tax=Thiohalomonas denitrificans TaxID=415747 RepID=A0A1G5QU60_9GAMM|nr:GspE/PulE family protein [Thiohalomonas denitrificans]SCZ65128.1 MSHA biogenesis protein MshE [Thiohalomonas denitrificans]